MEHHSNGRVYRFSPNICGFFYHHHIYCAILIIQWLSRPYFNRRPELEFHTNDDDRVRRPLGR